MNILLFANVIITSIKICLDLISLLKHCSCLKLNMHICPRPFVLVCREELEPTNKFIGQYFKIECFFDVDNIISFHQFASSFKLITYIFPEPFHTTTQTSQNNAGVSFTRYCSLFFPNSQHKCWFWSSRYVPLPCFSFFFSVVQAIFFL